MASAAVSRVWRLDNVQGETIDARHGSLWLVPVPALHRCTLDIREISLLANCIRGTTFRGYTQQSSLAGRVPVADRPKRTIFAQKTFSIVR